MPKMWHYVVLPFQTGVHGTRTRRMLLPTPVKGIPGQHCVGLQKSRLPAVTVQLGQVCQEGRRGWTDRGTKVETLLWKDGISTQEREPLLH